MSRPPGVRNARQRAAILILAFLVVVGGLAVVGAGGTASVHAAPSSAGTVLGVATSGGAPPSLLAPAGRPAGLAPDAPVFLPPRAPSLSSILRAPTGAAPVAAAGADLANPTIATFSLGPLVAAVGPSNQTVVVGYTNETYLADYEESGSSGAFFADGLAAYARTANAGASWSTGWIPNDPDWASSSDPGFGDVLWGADAVAGANGTALYAAEYAQPCAVLDLTPSDCNSSYAYAAPSGIAVARSTNGGASWFAAVPVDNVAQYEVQSIDCDDEFQSFYVPANLTDLASVAVSADGSVAAVSWDTIAYYDALGCVNDQVVLDVSAEYDLTQVAVSTDGGAAWGAPVTLGRLVSGPSTVAIGPAPTDAITVVFDDPENGTSTTFPFAASVSTDLGATWSAPADVGPASLVHPVVNAVSDSFPVVSLPELAEDTDLASPYVGTLYLVWADNRTAADGDPSVAFETGSGGGWSRSVYLTPPGGDLVYFDPAVSVAPGGAVWAVYVAENVTNGGYQLLGEYSTDGGAYWTAPFAIADGPSPAPPSGGSIGDWVGAAATSAGLYAAWTDCRSDDCASSGVPSVDVARSVPVALDSNVPGAQVTATSGGVTVGGTVPVPTAWDNNGGVTVTAPPWVILANTTDWVGVFEGFSGAVTSATAPVSFDFEGGVSVSANYAISPAGWIAGTIRPSDANVTLTLNGVPVAIGGGSGAGIPFNISVAPNLVYAVTVSAPFYDRYSTEVPVIPGVTTPLNVNLTRAIGWISGRVFPFSSVVTVNGSRAPVDGSDGLYNVTVEWGSYWVNVSSPGLTHLARLVVVSPGRVANVNASLIGGWIAGTVTPAGAVLTIDGAPVPTAGGVFNVSVLGGTHEVNVTLSGYSSFEAPIVVAPGSTARVVVTLSDVGWLSGTVDPITADVVVQGSPVAVVGGTFNVSLVGDARYNVTVQAAGYVTAWDLVAVRPVATSLLNIHLALAGPACTPLCPSSSTQGTASGPPYSYEEAAILAIAILGVAAEAAFLLVFVRPRAPPPRRRKELYAGPGSNAPSRPPALPPAGGAR